jgi:hypothetical protein
VLNINKALLQDGDDENHMEIEKEVERLASIGKKRVMKEIGDSKMRLEKAKRELLELSIKNK